MKERNYFVEERNRRNYVWKFNKKSWQRFEKKERKDWTLYWKKEIDETEFRGFSKETDKDRTISKKKIFL